MKSLLILILTVMTIPFFGQNCTMLTNGKYDLYYDLNDSISSSFEINNNQLFTEQNDEKKVFEIKILDPCRFKILNKEEIDWSQLSDIQKILAKQERSFEITKVEGNSYSFICIINEHINCGTGKFIRKE